MEIVHRILDQMPTITKPQRKFLSILFSTIFVLRGKVTFTNLSRYSSLSERTYWRQFKRKFDFMRFNQVMIEQALPVTSTRIAAMDCSFIKKSGKQTYGLGSFYNGCASRAEKGLEISLISIVDVETKITYSLSMKQTPPPVAAPSSATELAMTPKPKKSVGRPKGSAKTVKPPTPETRIDDYIKHLKASVSYFPTGVCYLVVDGFYAKTKFVTGVRDVGLQMIGKLRLDADLRYLYTGPQKARGARRKYAGKVDLKDVSKLDFVSEIETDIKLYTAIVYSVSLKRQIRIAYLLDVRDPNKVRSALLFSTDLEIDPTQIHTFYKCRFQIEFTFRDAKQFTGLSDCQARDQQKLDFHFNASLTAVNLAKLEARSHHDESTTFVFSLDDHKRRASNDFLLEHFISKLGLNPTLIKNHPNFESLRTYGCIAA